MTDYIARIWSALSQLLNVLLLNGHPNESISGRCYREQWWAERLVNTMCFWQDRHCRGAHAADRAWAAKYASLPARMPDERRGKF